MNLEGPVTGFTLALIIFAVAKYLESKFQKETKLLADDLAEITPTSANPDVRAALGSTALDLLIRVNIAHANRGSARWTAKIALRFMVLSAVIHPLLWAIEEMAS